jgi:hypothetical protein
MIVRPIPPIARLHSDTHPMLQALQQKLNKPIDVLIIRAVESLYRDQFPERLQDAKHDKEEMRSL